MDAPADLGFAINATPFVGILLRASPEVHL